MFGAEVKQNDKHHKDLLGIATIVIALQILPFSDIMAKYASITLPLIQVIWGRFFFHCVVTGLYSSAVYGVGFLKPNLSMILVVRSSALFAAVSLFYVTIHYLPLTTSLTLWFVEPFILTVMAAFFLKEKVTSSQWLAIFIGFFGIVIAIRPAVVAWHWAYLVGILAGFFYALFLFLTRFITVNVPAIVSVFHTGLVGGIAASFAVIPFWLAPSFAQWLLLLATGLVAAIAHLFIIKSFELAQASIIAPFTYSEIIMGAILGYIVFSDKPDLWLLIGLAIIIVSGIALARKSKA